MAELQK